ncbi:retrovirus-related pol polyprotein from transposon TNT 1-94 [Tanacetum coccineum]|uniref:Retrovirus-related pol polyprotein from transposon TNT 1-94 n=1 Tax=Tanacetum coccineum TaxID=301880 RepID=A0ABQ4X3G3_9ASTR
MSVWESFKDFDNGLHDELNEVKMIFNQMEAAVEQSFVDKKCFEIQNKELLLENDRLLELIISQDIVHNVINSLEFIDECESMRKSCNLDAPALNEFFVINYLKAQLQAKESLIRKLRAQIATLKGKNVSENNEPVNNASVIATGMFTLDLEPLSHRLKNNREAHEDYLKKTKEHTDTLRGIIEQARKQNPSDPYIDYALIPSTSASGSQSKNNTRKNKITPAASSNKKNKTIEVHPRKVMSRSNKRNHVSMCNANFKHAIKDTNSKFVCSTCNGCLFSANHDDCVVAYTNDMNKDVKSKSGKSKKMEWKPTGEVVQIVLWYLDSGCSKHMTGQHSQLINFVEKFLGTVRFGNDHIAKIMGKSKKHTHKPKSEDSIQEKQYLLHMDLCGPMRIESINGKKYILVIVDDYSRNIRTDNGTEFVNQTLKSYYKDVGISHQTSVTRTPQQNGVAERRNRALVKAARIMLIFSKAPLYLWAKVVATACYTKNRSLIRKPHNKTPYEILHDRKPDLKYLYVFGSLCYPTNDSEDLGKLKPKADIGIFIGYAPLKKSYRIYNRRTWQIMETIHVDFDDDNDGF